MTNEKIMTKTGEKNGEYLENIDKEHVNNKGLKEFDERLGYPENLDNEEKSLKVKNRMDQLMNLRKRMRLSAEANRKDLFSEYQRLKEDPKLAKKIEFKRQDAEKKLEKQESIERGEDYERKRAWDWTIEESERWDQRMKEKQEARDKSLFADYTQVAQHSYEKLMRKFKPDLETYEKERAKVVANKTILDENDSEVTNTYESFYRDANFLGFANNKPSKKAIDRLIEDLNKQKEMRNKSRRRIDPDDEDVSYINERNANFNRKISRFYDKYTREIRESLERGTAV
ncbi:hypothetical protein PNEG_02785 [Pneumocystis murina B123]|uniref:Pre-mRNA-splicing factor SYF2 n=1 Tax=Pneumocystis murina (strain B123) TaxID=1069680 RepID=M7P557_PNEMU|nr:hypothetical protein PNEG_02785 [Pneumocystis murina B123]EMR09010.2 hypothetical protein PNEG_02785 [Pneumocystis murina B123]